MVRIALAQIAPRLGALDDNLARHREVIDEARAGGADLIVFPELGLTGYQLQDLEWQLRELGRIVVERAGMALDSTAERGAPPGFVVAPGDHRGDAAARRPGSDPNAPIPFRKPRS